MKILIIGGGASGMMAALTASQAHEVVLLERQNRMGRKLLATGNGRCNLTNLNLSPDHYHGQAPDFCRFALESFSVEQTLDFFRSIGLVTTAEDSGRVYPYSDSANSVVDVLRLPLEHRENVTIVTGSEVQSISRKKGTFFAHTTENDYVGDAVIVSTGGVAGGKLGGTDLGYKLLASFGHTRTKLYPSLVQLRTDTGLVRSLKGVRCDALVRSDRGAHRGEVQFTDYGVSGPVIFEMSREAREGTHLTFDFLPDIPKEELEQMLFHRIRSMPKLKGEDLLTGIVHNRLGRTLLRACDCSLELCCESLLDNVTQIAQTMKAFTLKVLGTMGMDNAQVTAGGIMTSEFRPDTLESRLCKGLYACGEVLDIDGDCGGYNLQWAWSSGHLAGELRGFK